MPVIYDNTAKAARLNATRALFGNGALELLADDGTVLAIFALTGAAGAVTNDAWTVGLVAATTRGEAGAGIGTIATKARIKTAAGAARLTGLTIGVSEADIIVDNPSIAQNQAVALNSVTITHP